MEGIKFNNLHTYLDYGLVLKSKEISTPLPKSQIVEIPGADGQIDLTEYLGEVKYSNRTLGFEFEIVKRQKDFIPLFSSLQNDIHGQRVKVILDIDRDFYYTGRATVDPWKSDKKIGKVYIEVDCEPYKYKINETVSSIVVSSKGKETINLKNLKKPVTPKIEVSGVTKIKYNYDATINAFEAEQTVSEGVWTIDNLLLTKGDNYIGVEAAAGTTVTFTYQEGGL